MVSGQKILFRDAVAAIDKINGLFKDRTAGLNAFQQLTKLLLDTKRRFILYLGAGCSKQVSAVVPPGEPPYVGRDWDGLLQALLEKLPRNEQLNFFKSLSQREGGNSSYLGISDLFKHYDKQNVAWYLSCQFSNKNERDRHIKDIVEPSELATRSSPLLDQLRKLPFRDIVTTNYDSNIHHFLDPPKNTLREITCTKNLSRALEGDDTPRLFYLHGKAGHSDLVLDRFDYAQLLAERDGILDYVTFLLRNSHVLYIGFGLDDPTFNLMETRLNSSPDAKVRPESFAFLPNTTEGERAVWLSRKLCVVDYGDHNILADLFECMNEVRDFVHYAEPDRRPNLDPQADRTGAYIRQAAQNYVSGEFGRSILDYRAALGSTVLWERDDKGDYLKPGREELVCDILIRLAQSHYKLRWNPRSEKGGDDHSKRMERNLEDAREIIDRMKRGAIVPSDPSALIALQNSISVLDGRIKYHDGKYIEARDIYTTIVSQTAQHATELMLGNEAIKIWKLKIAEAHYYSQCQISRIDYQVRPGRCDWRKQQIKVLRDVRRKTRELCTRIAESKQGFSTDEETNHYLYSFATILRIAQWTEGRLAISIFSDVLPVQAERSDHESKELSSGISLLQSDPWHELCKSVPSLMDKENWGAPSRWLAMKYRYEARGRALRWVVSTGTDTAQGFGDLIEAYASIQRAVGQTSGRDLERQEMLNVLEATRLSILVMFGERVMRGPQAGGVRSTPFGCGVALYHLNEAFNMIESLETPSRDQWHCVLAHRLASYFALLAAPIQEGELSNINNKILRSFLRLSAKQMKDDVVKRYTQFASDSDENHLLGERIASYQQTFDLVQSEIQGIAAGKSA